jgi:hypothetical protein
VIKEDSVMILAELTFGQTVAADALSALFTAVFVGFAATFQPHKNLGIYEQKIK